MCTSIKTRSLRLLVDAGVALGPRFGLLPHPVEYEARKQARLRIRKAARDSSVITLSHYHNDHHTPNFTDQEWIGCSPSEAKKVYEEKLIMAKDGRTRINFSQRRRAWIFESVTSRYSKSIDYGDGRVFEFEDTKLEFSQPVPHGEEDSALGWVLILTVSEGDQKVMHAPDVQGPISKQTTDYILKSRPDLLILGGPPMYLESFRSKTELVEAAQKNMSKLAKSLSTVILDHHLIRSDDWANVLKPLRRDAMKHGNQLMTAAEYLSQENNWLEAARKRLYEKSPPSPEFSRWTKLPEEKRRRTQLPLG